MGSVCNCDLDHRRVGSGVCFYAGVSAMTKDDIILMADASGLSYYGMGKDREKFIYYLKAFSNLVATAERDKYEVQFKKLMQLHEVRESQPNKPCCLAEREAIVQMFEGAPALVQFAQNDKGGCLICGFTPKIAIETIRARGNT